MNSYLDKGLFLAVYVGIIQFIDYVTVDRGYISFTGMWVGAIVLLIIGLLISMYGKNRS